MQRTVEAAAATMTALGVGSEAGSDVLQEVTDRAEAMERAVVITEGQLLFLARVLFPARV